MVTFGYLFLWFTGNVAALLIGLVTHYQHANLQPYPDKLFDGGGISDTILNELMSPEHRVYGEYDDAGWWEFNSLRNFAYHAVPWLIVVQLTAIWNWSERAEAVAYACRGLKNVGIVPLFCS